MKDFIENLIDDFKDFFGPMIIYFTIAIFIIMLPIIIISWFSSCRSAEIYNKQHNTNWTCSDFLWASEQINSQTQTIKLDR